MSDTSSAAGESQINFTDVEHAALWYAERAIATFPLSRSKKPLALCDECRGGGCPGRDECVCPYSTCHAFYAATCDRQLLSKWFTRKSWSLAIRTGAVSGIVVLDVDFHQGGRNALTLLRAQGFVGLETPTVRSGSGTSEHYYYRHPGVWVPNSAGTMGPGLDVRGDGGYVVAAPSRHPATGKPYTLHKDLRDLSVLPVWPMPPAAPTTVRKAAKVQAPKPVSASSVGSRRSPAMTLGVLTQTRLRSWVDRVLAATEGSRRSVLFWAASRLAESEGSAADRFAAAMELHQAGVAVGLSSSEAFATVLSALEESG